MTTTDKAIVHYQSPDGAGSLDVRLARIITEESSVVE